MGEFKDLILEGNNERSMFSTQKLSGRRYNRYLELDISSGGGICRFIREFAEILILMFPKCVFNAF